MKAKSSTGFTLRRPNLPERLPVKNENPVCMSALAAVWMLTLLCQAWSEQSREADVGRSHQTTAATSRIIPIDIMPCTRLLVDSLLLRRPTRKLQTLPTFRHNRLVARLSAVTSTSDYPPRRPPSPRMLALSRFHVQATCMQIRDLSHFSAPIVYPSLNRFRSRAIYSIGVCHAAMLATNRLCV
jgi:hypothetical protein